MGRVDELLTWEHRSDAASPVLVITTAWPNPDSPARGIFVQRQVAGLLARGVPLHVLSIRGDRSARAYLAAARELRFGETARRRYRLIHAQSGEAGLVAWLHPLAPTLITYFGSDILGRRDEHGASSWRSQLRATAIARACTSATATVTQSEEMHARIPRRCRARDHVLLNGVDLGRFKPIPQSEARAQLGWPTEGRVAIFVAAQATTPLKRLPLARQAVTEAQHHLADLRLEIVSNVSPELMPTIMSAADCLLHTSATEGSPNVVKEAMACNLPVVATSVGDIGALLDGVSKSFVCDPIPAALAEGLVNAMTGEGARSNGRAKAALFDQDRVIDRLLEVYDLVTLA